MTAAPGWYPDPDGHGGQRYFDGSRWTDDRVAKTTPSPWTAMPVAGWIAISVGVLIVVAVIIGITVTSASRDRESYRYGYEQISPVALFLLEQGVDGTEYACQQATGASIWTDPNLVEDDVVTGCVDALND